MLYSMPAIYLGAVKAEGKGDVFIEEESGQLVRHEEQDSSLRSE